MSKRAGVVTGVGDYPGLNAVIRAVAKSSANRGWEGIGVIGGYEGLLAIVLTDTGCICAFRSKARDLILYSEAIGRRTPKSELICREEPKVTDS